VVAIDSFRIAPRYRWQLDFALCLKYRLQKAFNGTVSAMVSIDNGADLGIEAALFKAADKLRGNMEPSDYKHVALGLIFLKHISAHISQVNL